MDELTLQYEDDEGDRITLSLENDLDDALNYAVEQGFKIIESICN